MTEQPREPSGVFETERSAEIVAASFAGAQDARLREILTSLVRHATDSAPRRPWKAPSIWSIWSTRPRGNWGTVSARAASPVW